LFKAIYHLHPKEQVSPVLSFLSAVSGGLLPCFFTPLADIVYLHSPYILFGMSKRIRHTGEECLSSADIDDLRRFYKPVKALEKMGAFSI